MTWRPTFMGCALGLLLLALLASLCFGSTNIAVSAVLASFLAFDANDYDNFIVQYQRLPRALIAMFVGAVMACGGAVLQGLTRNPLASPSILAISSGATLFVVSGLFLMDLSSGWQGVAAVAGGLFGFASCLFVTRMTGMSQDPRGLGLVLSGAVLSMLYSSIASTLLLASPSRRADLLSWVTGNINHVYAERLYDFWWLGIAGLATLIVLARPLTLVNLGREKAASAGVNVRLVTLTALGAVVLSTSAAVAICGPVGFVGLIVPHIVRPLFGANLSVALPANAALGATTCLLADIAARTAFSPYVLHTGVMMDLLGGVVFAVIVKRLYLTPGARGTT